MLLLFLLNGLLNITLVCNFHFTQRQSPSSAITTQVPLRSASNKNTLNPMPGLNIESEAIKMEGKDKIIFEGSVVLRRNELTTFHANKVIVETSDGKKVASIQMVGKVSMERKGIVIRSERAFSDNFDLYVDFSQNITLTFTDGREVKPIKLRYSFKTGDISMEGRDTGTAG